LIIKDTKNYWFLYGDAPCIWCDNLVCAGKAPRPSLYYLRHMAGIYIHIPFCKQACHYCNFYFSVSTTLKPDLIKAIVKEIELSKDYLNGEVIETIYFGGGTPSLLSADEVKSILDAICHFHPNINLQELTLEANPDDLTPEKINELSSLRQYGLDRLSIGVQSFYDADLIYMNRAHSAEEAPAAIKRAQDAGFENLTIDLIYGTPTMPDGQWADNIKTALALDIPHISSYALTIEPKTYLDKYIRSGRARPVDEAQTVRQFDILMNTMREQKYDQYEISNFARPGRHAIHNTNYWRGKKYLGLGPSAHSYDGQARRWNVANNLNYIKSINGSVVPAEVEILSPAQQANEYIMTSLRTMWGLDISDVRLMMYDLSKSLDGIDPAFYIFEGTVLKLTQKGKHYADRIAAELFIED
jgi:oxygen-independent coproporphyrinogen-3 oxidase